MVGVTGSIPVARTISQASLVPLAPLAAAPATYRRATGSDFDSWRGRSIRRRWSPATAISWFRPRSSTAVLGMWLFNESRDIARIVCLLLIVAGVIGLKVVTPNAG